jgi:L-arabinose isomerase
MQGEALSTEMVFPGNPVRVRFPHQTKHIIDWIFEAGIVHHWMVGYGHSAAEIRALAGIVGREFRLLEPAIQTFPEQLGRAEKVL